MTGNNTAVSWRRGNLPGRPLPLMMKGLLIGVVITGFFISQGCELLKNMVEEKTSPEVGLVLVRGPEEVPGGEGRYLFEIKAVVEGNPAPRVVFNRDDSMGQAGKNRVTVILHAGDSFTVMAIATSSGGSASASLELHAQIPTADSAGKPGPTPAPGVTTATPGTSAPTSGVPSVTPDASTPAPGTPTPAAPMPTLSAIVPLPSLLISFQPTVYPASPSPSPAPLPSASAFTPFPTLYWPSPSPSPGLVPFPSLMIPLVFSVTLSPVRNESGQVSENGYAFTNSNVYAGDDSGNRMVRGFISFNITGLAGKTVRTARLTLAEPIVQSDPSFMLGIRRYGLWIEAVSYGARPLIVSDYYLRSTIIKKCDYDYDINLFSDAADPATRLLCEELQRCLDDGLNRFQVRLRYTYEVSDFDNQWDGVGYQPGTISLGVTYH